MDQQAKLPSNIGTKLGEAEDSNPTSSSIGQELKDLENANNKGYTINNILLFISNIGMKSLKSMQRTWS